MENRDRVLNAVAMVVAAIAPLLIMYGLVTQEEAELWVQLVLAIAAVIVPVVVAQTAQNWTRSQAQVQVSAIQAGVWNRGE